MKNCQNEMCNLVGALKIDGEEVDGRGCKAVSNENLCLSEEDVEFKKS